MKEESGFQKIGHTIISEGKSQEDETRQSIIPAAAQDASKAKASVSKPGVGKARVSKSGKPKVIPLRQEDIEAGTVSAGRNRMMWVLVVVLGAAMGFVVMRSMKTSKLRRQRRTAAGMLAIKNETAATQTPIMWKVPKEIGDSVRDVTGSAVVDFKLPKKDKLPDILVSGIVVYSDENKSAIIGDRIVKVGDVIDGVIVHEITNDSVVFEKDEIRWIINID
jgi:hypothetical protein